MVSKQRMVSSLVILLTVAAVLALVFFSEITTVRDDDHVVRFGGNTVVTYGNGVPDYNGNSVVNNGDSWKFSSNRSTDPVYSETCQKRFPGAIIAGIMKCGTWALLVFLNCHPEIKAAISDRNGSGTEIKFFHKKYEKGLKWYRNQMPCSFSNQVTIEKDPEYFWCDFCPPRIRKMDPATKIIIIVKEPIERALSHHAMKRARFGGGSFERQITHKNGDIDQNHIYLRRSSYTLFIDPWIEKHGLEHIHFVDGHVFEDSPVTELAKLEDFLKLKHYFNKSTFWKNETKGKQCFYTNKKVATCLGKNKGRKHEDIPEGLRKRLQAYFKPLNEEFFRKIKKRFLWEY